MKLTRLDFICLCVVAANLIFGVGADSWFNLLTGCLLAAVWLFGKATGSI